MTGELVPLTAITFQDGQKLYTTSLPRDTRDVRWRACIQHQFACDCREAEMAEDRAELRGELKYFRRIFAEVLKGHATHGRNEFDQCSCTGCEIARRTGLRRWLDVDNERHEALGEPVRGPLPWLDSDVPF